MDDSRFLDDAYDSDADATSLVTPQTDPFASAGQKSILQLLSHPETRLSSKIRVKTATQGGTWADRYICALWANRLQAWRVGVLRVDPESTPTGEHVCRFLVSFVEVYHKHTSERKGVLSYDTMVHATKKLKKALVFKYEDFDLKGHWKARIDSVLCQMVNEGMLTRELKRSREPAGAVVMRRVIEALYTDAITAGTNGWNTTLNDIAILLLLTCLGVRVGDITGTTNDVRPDLPGLWYNDVDLKVTKEGMKARFRIRSGKGMKLDGKKFYYIHRDGLRDSTDNIMDPIKVILILALRSGGVHERCMGDILQTAATRPDHRVVWAFPDRPVLCAADNVGVDWDTPVHRLRANRTLNKALDVMGLRGTGVTISPHQIRYGMAHDLTITKPTNLHHTNDQISNALAHSSRTKARDTVLAYTGSFMNEDTWAARVSLTANNDAFSELVGQTDNRPPSRQLFSKRPSDETNTYRKRRRGAEVEKDCQDAGLDPTQKNNRHYYSRISEKPGSGSESAFLMGEGDEANMNTDEETLGFDIDDIVTDVRVQESDGDTIALLLTPDCTNTSNGIAEYDESMLASLTGDPIDFVDLFATVNVVRTSHKGSRALEYARRCGEDPTNTVDKVSCFTFRCRNASNGCQYCGARDIYTLESHHLVCKFTEPVSNLPVKPGAKKQSRCSIEGCGRAYNAKRELDAHVRDRHQPVRCFVPGCTDNNMYEGEKALLDEHVKLAHPAKGRLHPTIPDQKQAKFKCPEEDCDDQFNVCTGKDGFAVLAFHRHLSEKHHIKSKVERDTRVPVWAGNPCFFPGCRSEQQFPANKDGRKAYSVHLAAKHAVDESEQFEYSWIRVRGFALPARPSVGTKSQGARNTARAAGGRARPIVIEDSEEE